MLVLPTSSATAILFEQSQGSPYWALFGYVTIALLFACAYCTWEMIRASLRGRRPARSRWIALVVSAVLFGSGVLVDAALNAPAGFNGTLETTWGFVLSPWFFIAFIPCSVVLVVLRAIDSLRMPAFAHVPGAVWWFAGLVLTSAYGVGALWSGGRAATIEASFTAGGWVLAAAGIATLAAAGFVRRGRGD